VGFVGQLKPEKGVNVLIEALAEIHYLDWKALIVGDGPSRKALESQVELLNLGERVVFSGYVPQTDVGRYIRCMSVLVLPSTLAQWEQFGHVLIEAMSCGKPVIGSESGEIPNVIGDAGLVFPMGDRIALTKCLTTFIQSPEAVVVYGRRGLGLVKEKYSEMAIAQRLRALYQRMCFGVYNV
jgi:glycosyltransferase involved in cell wall biosynthesis